MNLTPDYISNVIEDQFPEFFREQNSDVVALVMAYFEYLEQENKTTKLEFCPIISGLNFLDQVKSLETLEEIKFEKIAFPLLFLPFISRASEVIGKKLELKIDNRIFLLNYNNSIYSNSLNEGIVEIGNNISIKFLENKDSFEVNEWKELYKLSENTFVEESDSLKQAGAGAGLTDND